MTLCLRMVLPVGLAEALEETVVYTRELKEEGKMHALHT
jgi:hypothetical protein